MLPWKPPDWIRFRSAARHPGSSGIGRNPRSRVNSQRTSPKIMGERELVHKTRQRSPGTPLRILGALNHFNQVLHELPSAYRQASINAYRAGSPKVHGRDAFCRSGPRLLRHKKHGQFPRTLCEHCLVVFTYGSYFQNEPIVVITPSNKNCR